MEMGEPILSVPNWAVREQLYGYMADIYKDSADLYLETDKVGGPNETNGIQRRMGKLLHIHCRPLECPKQCSRLHRR